MSTIVLRSAKGSPLTNAEVDANFTNLNNDKTQLGGTYSSGTANGVLFLSPSKVLTTGSALTFDGSSMVLNTSTSSSALRITQLGAGNALLVEDTTNPDSTPFVIDNNGTVIAGYTGSVVTAGSAVAPRMQVHGAGGGSASLGITSWQTGGNVAGSLVLSRSEGATIGTQAIVDSGDHLGNIRFAGSDGTAFIEAAKITGEVDGTPGTNDMPGRLVFSTTAAGASSPTERLRLNSSGATVTGAVTLSGGTANGVAYLNGSKVLTTGSALTFDGNELYIAGASTRAEIRLGSTGYIKGGSNVGDTRILADRFRLYDLAGTQLSYNLASTGEQTWYVGGSEQMRLTSTGLGIGTSSPSQKLDVYGNAISVRDGTFNGLIGRGASVVGGGGAADLGITTTTGNILFSTGGSFAERMRLDSSGNLGLGVTPSAWGTASSRRAIELPGGGNIWGQNFGGSNPSMQVYCNAYESSTGSRYVNSAHASGYQQNAGTHAWFTAPSGTAGNAISFTQAMTLDASGNLAIGRTAATTRLHIKSASDNADVLQIQDASEAQQMYMGVSAANGGPYLFVATNQALRFGTNNTERARIDSSGNLLVGYSSGGPATGPGVVKAAAYNTKAGYGAALGVNLFNINWSGSTAALYIDTTNVGNISLTSDYRIKQKIETQTAPALERVMQLRPVTYELQDYRTLFKADGIAREGFIAHELQTVIPSAVEGEKDAENQVQSLKLDALVSVLTKAIQEQQAIITALTARVAALESN